MSDISAKLHILIHASDGRIRMFYPWPFNELPRPNDSIWIPGKADDETFAYVTVKHVEWDLASKEVEIDCGYINAIDDFEDHHTVSGMIAAIQLIPGATYYKFTTLEIEADAATSSPAPNPQ